MTQTPPYYYPPQAPVPAPGKGLATAALVLGLCSLIPFLGVFCAILAIIFAFMAMAKKSPGKNLAVVGLIVAVVGILESAGVMFLAVQRLIGARESARRTMCGSNLKTLGMNVAMYMADNNDVPPTGLNVLMNSQSMLQPRDLECPSANTPPGRAPVFILFPSRGDVPPTTLIACDYRGNHADGRNVLYHNGMVTFVKTEAAFQAELAKPENAAFAAALRAKEGP